MCVRACVSCVRCAVYVTTTVERTSDSLGPYRSARARALLPVGCKCRSERRTLSVVLHCVYSRWHAVQWESASLSSLSFVKCHTRRTRRPEWTLDSSMRREEARYALRRSAKGKRAVRRRPGGEARSRGIVALPYGSSPTSALGPAPPSPDIAPKPLGKEEHRRSFSLSTRVRAGSVKPTWGLKITASLLLSYHSFSLVHASRHG